jgi:hypothetical protein
MLIQETFSKVLLDNITQLVSKLESQSANEFEFRLGKYDKGNFVPGQNVLQFKSIIEYLQRKKYKFEETDSLDIGIHGQSGSMNLGNVRLTIAGLDNIRHFCLSEKIPQVDPAAMKYIRKVKLNQPINLIDYNLRGQFANETDITDDGEIGKIHAAIENPAMKKYYRYKHRYSFQSNEVPVRFDLTMVKSNEGLSFKKANVLDQIENYEIEIEYTGGKVTKDSDPQVLADTMFGDLYDLLKWSQASFAISTNTERLAIFNEYRGMAFADQTNSFASHVDLQGYFISMNVIPLEREHITPDAQDNYALKEGYSVTDKADGDHHVMLISNHNDYKGRIYLINNRMDIKQTGLKIQNPLLYGCMFDGELVSLKNSGAFKFLIFDCFFWASEDQRALPLYVEGSPLKNIGEIKCRYQAIIKFNEQKGTESLSSGVNLTFGYKEYRFKTPQSDQSILQLTGEIYNPELYPYNLDGCIFTPYNQPYPKARLGQQIKWDALLKWKPPAQQTIDFMVYITRKNGADVVKFDSDPKTKDSWQYKEIHLKVGKTIYTKGKAVKQIIDFVPAKYKIADVHIIRLKLDSDGEIRTKEGDIIYHESIVEFAYEPQNLPGYQWVPHRFRTDKTALKNPNAERTANSVWTQIQEPVLLKNITGEEKLTSQVGSLQYYLKPDNLEELSKKIQPMRTFHNAIKSLLYSGVAQARRNQSKGANSFSKTLTLLDVAGGQGGDLYKYREARIDEVLFIDNDEGNLTNAKDGAMARYLQMKEEPPKGKPKSKNFEFPRKVNFIWADSSRPLTTGEAGHDKTNQNLLRSYLINKGPASFDIVTCQFAIHYFFGKASAFENLFNSVSMNLAPGGYFIGTTLNGREVYDQLQDKPSISGSITIKNNPQVVWKIDKKYPEAEAFKDWGQEVDIFNVNIGQSITEYLVNFDFMVSVAKKYGLELIKDNEVAGAKAIMSFKDYHAQADKLFKFKLEEIKKMSEDEQRYSFMNRSFIFKKVGSGLSTAIKEGLLETGIPVIPDVLPAPAPVAIPNLVKKLVAMKQPLTVKQPVVAPTEVPTPAQAQVIKKAPILKKPIAKKA